MRVRQHAALTALCGTMFLAGWYSAGLFGAGSRGTENSDSLPIEVRRATSATTESAPVGAPQVTAAAAATSQQAAVATGAPQAAAETVAAPQASAAVAPPSAAEPAVAPQATAEAVAAPQATAEAASPVVADVAAAPQAAAAAETVAAPQATEATSQPASADTPPATAMAVPQATIEAVAPPQTPSEPVSAPQAAAEVAPAQATAEPVVAPQVPAAQAPAQATAEPPVAPQVPAARAPAQATAEPVVAPQVPAARAPAQATAEPPVAPQVPAAQAPAVQATAPSTNGTAVAVVASADPDQQTFVLASVSPADMATVNVAPPDYPPPLILDSSPARAQGLRPAETPDECLVAEICIDRYLFSLYQRAPKLDSMTVTDKVKTTVKTKKGKLRTVIKSVSRLVDENFAWKDPKAAERVGMPMMDYVIGGMDRRFKVKLFQALQAADEAGLQPGITSGFRDDYRQGIASGKKAATDRSYHGGSFRGGYGHGLAADIVSVRGANRMERYASSEALWKWVDTHGKEYGIGRPYLDRDPPHVGPTDGKEYVDKRGIGKAQRVASQPKKRARVAVREVASAKRTAATAPKAGSEAKKPAAVRSDPSLKRAATSAQRAALEAKKNAPVVAGMKRGVAAAPRAASEAKKTPPVAGRDLATMKHGAAVVPRAGSETKKRAGVAAKTAKPAKVSSL